MTEAEWFASKDPQPMLKVLPRKKNIRRKRQLFVCACCRLIRDHLPAEVWRTALEVNERFVEGEASKQQRATAMATAVAKAGCPLSASAASRACRSDGSHDDARIVAHYATYADKDCKPLTADLLRDIFGNPFRPVSLDPAWLTSDVLALARGIYDERAFDRMPILADALQDAGCTSDDVLSHCRDANQVHVRGCWVLDLILGKA